MTKPIAAVFASVLLAALPAVAQTATELLERGIYAQETEGNVDNAVLIYRQIVNSAPAQRDIAAQAQYRLAQALLQKGDLVTAAKEFDTLSRNYADYSGLVSSLSQRYYSRGGEFRFQVTPGGRGGRGGPDTAKIDAARQARVAELMAKLAELRTQYAPGHPEIRKAETQLDEIKSAVARAGAEATFWHADTAKPITIKGTVTKVQWQNPRAVVDVQVANADGTMTLWGFQLGAPNTLVKNGFARTTLTLGETVTVNGYLAQEDPGTVDLKYALPTSITLSDGRTFNTSSQE
ncbi:MAG: hypothetical protein JO307_26825 [Bryobacterales bacterium]|nr:hypothetical protein [Bryobacterales bacterium]MBV9398048.1 hypothetical protein [Bryobacterales bacterium]